MAALFSLIEPYLYQPFASLPPEVREHVGEDFTPDTWDALSGTGRYLWVRAWDDRNDAERADFARASTHSYWFKLQGEIAHAEREVAEAQSLAPISLDDADSSQAHIASQQARLEELQGKWFQPDDLMAKEQLTAGRAAAQSQLCSVGTMSRALQFLSENTGVTWSDGHLFSLVSNSDICLHAVVPPWTQMHLVKWKGISPAILPLVQPGCEVLATLGPHHVQEVWVTGRTTTSDAVLPESILLDPDSQVHLKAPVGVSRSDLRFTREVVLSILKKWEESRQAATPIAPLLAAASPAPQRPVQGKSITHKLRTNSLDAPIKKAITRAGSLETGAVYLHLRELALSGEPPFLGTTEGAALCYTNDKNEPDKLTKGALGKRLKLHHL